MKVRIAVVAVCLVLLGVYISHMPRSKPVPTVNYGQAPVFSLTESSGRNVTSQELQGKVWIADFIFTTCAGLCPIMTSQMKKLQDTLPAEIRLVSFSVDPAHDTPAVLSAYAKRYAVDGQRWMFLTGDRTAIYDLTMKGFKLPLDDTQGTEVEPITHSSRFVLVDRKGQIKGYYDGTDEDDLKRLTAAAKEIL